MTLARFQRAAVGAWAKAAGRARAADWWAVGGELAVVVLGILIAFQLDRWSESWRRARDRELYLERLVEETAENSEALKRLDAEFREVTDGILALLQRLEHPSLRPRVATAQDPACRSLHLPAPRLQLSAIEEGGAAAALELVPDPELRLLLHSAAAEDRYADRQLEYFRASFQRFGSLIDPHTRWKPGPKGLFTCSLDFDALAREPAALSTLSRIFRDRSVFAGIHSGQLVAQQKVHDRALCLLKESC